MTNMGRVITLTTDFSTSDAYVGAMKGVILSINPGVTIVDISHEIEPQSVSQAAYVLHTAYRYFPEGTIHIVVVDPGVGTERRAVIMKTREALFVAPDNGVLSYVIGNMIEAVTITRGRFSSMARSIASVTFSPTTAPIEAMMNEGFIAPRITPRPRINARPTTTASRSPVLACSRLSRSL